MDAGDDQGASLQQQIPAVQLQSTEYVPQRWDYFVQHYDDQTYQETDSKMSWRLPNGKLYVGANPPGGAKPLGILYPRAGTLGGCSSHNAMITILPHNSDWNNLVSITGDNSWAPTSMRQYWERLERCRYLPNGISGHGFDGWFETSLTDLRLVVEDRKLLSLIISAATAMGHGLLGMLLTTVTGLAQILISDINNDAPNRDSVQGLYQVPLAIKLPESKRNGPRDFILETANAVNPDGSRMYHLDLRFHALVTKIRFDQSGSVPKAVGVDFLDGQSLYRADPRSGSASATGAGSVNVTREVIISAGTFNTPQLLKLSGIGPAAELKKFDIPVVVNLPGVGTNLMDRYETGLVGKSPTNFTITQDCTFLNTTNDPCLLQWQNDALFRGTYATNGIAIAIVKKSSAASSSDDPDLLISGAPAFFSGYFPGYSNVALSDAKHWTWIVLKAHSRNNAGTVMLHSADPRDTPDINFRNFQNGGAQDIQAVYEAMQFSRKMFADLIPLDGGFNEVWPGPNTNTETAMKDFIKKEAWGHHACCTAKIGADSDPMAVLDGNFNVRGTKGLRVVDASVFPKIPGFYIAAPIYMISEKAADVIIAAAKASG
jgi:choline dehydrogenase